ISAVSPVSVRTPTGVLSYRGNPFREEIRIYARNGTCDVVNAVDLEKYLDGLVNSEFSAKWNAQSIEAQVIAARTYALYQIREAEKKSDSYFDVEATIKDQMYSGFNHEDFRAAQSVEQTRGMVLVAMSG